MVGDLAAGRRSSSLAASPTLGTSCRTVLGADLDPVCLIVDVEDSLLDLVVDLPGSVDKCLLHISGSLGGGLHEYEAVFSCEGFSLLSLDVSPGLQITANIHV